MNKRILAMPPEERAERSAAVQDRVVTLPEFADAKCVAAYVAMPFEVSTLRIVGECLAQGKTLALPRTDWGEHRMAMIRVRDVTKDLEQGPKGIIEPAGDEQIAPGTMDFVVVPGRAFDRSGNRIGQGGGFYDAFLGSLRPDCVTCAVAFDLQVLDDVPVCDYDVPVDMVAAESALYRAT